ncbi:helix-turn-helix domain-containing protein [Xanthobacter autotrophicus DSM 597]|uniref:helix-turn-helix domain-containing protein n=1 Tax=Xanthobacter wiegelii TaxID=3119913 RepID=UPI00372A1949
MPRLLTMEEAAEQLGIGIKTLREHVRHGEMPFISMGRGEKRKRRMFDPADLQAFVAARREREPCPSIEPKTARCTTTISNIEVYDFTALQAARAAEKQSASKNRSGRPQNRR